MPTSSHATAMTDARIPRTPGSLVLMLPTDLHPSMWGDGALGQWTSHTFKGKSEASVRDMISTDFGHNVYVGTIAGKAAKSYLTNEDKTMVRQVFSKARKLYRKNVESILEDLDEDEWSSKHADAYSKAFRTAILKPDGEDKTDDTYKVGIFAPPGTSCPPSESPITDLAIIPRVLTAKELLIIAVVPSAEPALDIHTIGPTEEDDSSTVTAVSVQTDTRVSTLMSSPADTDSRKRRRVLQESETRVERRRSRLHSGVSQWR